SWMVPAGEHTSWSAPASAGAAAPSNTRIVTSSLGGFTGHAPLLTDQRNVWVPTTNPVIVVLGSFGAVMVPEPLTSVHVPCAGKGAALAVIVTVLVGVQTSWSGPALAPLTVLS